MAALGSQTVCAGRKRMSVMGTKLQSHREVRTAAIGLVLKFDGLRLWGQRAACYLSVVRLRTQTSICWATNRSRFPPRRVGSPNVKHCYATEITAMAHVRLSRPREAFYVCLQIPHSLDFAVPVAIAFLAWHTTLRLSSSPMTHAIGHGRLHSMHAEFGPDAYRGRQMAGLSAGQLGGTMAPDWLTQEVDALEAAIGVTGAGHPPRFLASQG